ncbi:hypothetical protein ACSBR1_013250 [Camellia fascicularis]
MVVSWTFILLQVLRGKSPPCNWKYVKECKGNVSVMDELVQQAKLYRISWHLLHFLKDHIFLDRRV